MVEVFICQYVILIVKSPKRTSRFSKLRKIRRIIDPKSLTVRIELLLIILRWQHRKLLDDDPSNLLFFLLYFEQVIRVLLDHL